MVLVFDARMQKQVGQEVFNTTVEIFFNFFVIKMSLLVKTFIFCGYHLFR